MRTGIHLKIGGDHGGNSFKMSFQIVNMKNPNSKENTMVFAMFEAKDYRSNLEITLNMYKQQIDDLQLMKWKNRNINVFMFGDYQFQCTAYGLTGANGRHCCIYCVATKQEIQEYRNEDVEDRTLESIISDFKKYCQNGNIYKNAKLYNNTIYAPMFNIPVSQLCPAGLYILENEAQCLDLKITEKNDESCIYQYSYSNYKHLFNRRQRAEDRSGERCSCKCDSASS